MDDNFRIFLVPFLEIVLFVEDGQGWWLLLAFVALVLLFVVLVIIVGECGLVGVEGLDGLLVLLCEGFFSLCQLGDAAVVTVRLGSDLRVTILPLLVDQGTAANNVIPAVLDGQLEPGEQLAGDEVVLTDLLSVDAVDQILNVREALVSLVGAILATD